MHHSAEYPRDGAKEGATRPARFLDIQLGRTQMVQNGPCSQRGKPFTNVEATSLVNLLRMTKRR